MEPNLKVVASKGDEGLADLWRRHVELCQRHAQAFDKEDKAEADRIISEDGALLRQINDTRAISAVGAQIKLMAAIELGSGFEPIVAAANPSIGALLGVLDDLEQITGERFPNAVSAEREASKGGAI